jgi:uncharacterized lipoprotein YddW (UPF0748 family)
MRIALVITALVASAVASAPARVVRSEVRALWVDTFNTTLNTHADVVRVVRGAEDAKVNVILAQVRRRGDAWYLDAKEPPPDFVPIAANFDPLADLIATAHVSGIQVHAFVIAGAIWNKDPALAPPANGPPLDARHVFNQHGGYDPATRTIVAGPHNWLTRTLLPDGAASTYQGHRIGSDFWLDYGHPAAAAYTVDVLAHLVSRYDLDGLHLDRIRYPELTAAGQTAATGANIGYNPVSVARFARYYRRSPDEFPAPGDPQWGDWRRLQVTNLVRRIYLTALSIKPRLIVSAALIAFGGGPASDDAWRGSEAYWRVYQDWRGWVSEGILDVGFVMNYKREHDAAQARQFDEWASFIGSRQHNRLLFAGVGAHLNGVEGSVRQVRRALTVAPGTALYSFATASDPVSNNPYSWPPGQSTPRRVFGELAAALTIGRSLDGTTRYVSPADEEALPFADEALMPVMPWKQTPVRGHLAGFAVLPTGTVFDTARVWLVEEGTRTVREMYTDGGGFFGAVDLDPGDYVMYLLAGRLLLGDRVRVVAGRVSEVTLRPLARW